MIGGLLSIPLELYAVARAQDRDAEELWRMIEKEEGAGHAEWADAGDKMNRERTSSHDRPARAEGVDQ